MAQLFVSVFPIQISRQIADPGFRQLLEQPFSCDKIGLQGSKNDPSNVKKSIF
jgi:hypothetical protein